jgi:hypothetical protein
LRPHIISLGNDGQLRTDGTYGTSEEGVAEIFAHIAKQPSGRQRLLLYAHGGLVPEDSAIQKVADLRRTLLDAGVYPLSLIWKTDFWTTLGNMLQDAVSRRRPEGFLDATKDFMLDLYRQQYLPAIASGQLQRFALFTLTDKAERDDDCANIYHKSLLYLVSNAFETRWRKPLFGQTDGEPLLGMEKFVRLLPESERPHDWVLSPNTAAVGERAAARATTHGGFDDDGATLRATLARILDAAKSMAAFEQHHSASANKARRAAWM